jgi:hypothetical protein
MTNGARRRRCAWCGNTIDWNTRRDAKFCANKCRQADYRLRLRFDRLSLRFGGHPVPGVRDRVPFEFEEFEVAELPWMYADRQPYWGNCVEPMICRLCSALIAAGADAMVIGPGGFSAGEAGPFCGGDCALDYVFARP